MSRFFWLAALVLAIHVLAIPATMATAAEPDETLLLLREARRFAEAYPETVTAISLEGDDRLLLHLTGERQIVYHEARDAQYDADGQRSNATLHQTLSQPYTPGPDRPRPAKGFSPGRIRCNEWLDALYGATKAELVLTTFKVKGKSVTVAARHGMSTAFARVATELDRLHANPAVKPYILPMGGQYWRTIAGTSRLSAHSYGIAIDLNPDKGPYWRWSKSYPESAVRTYPEELVSLFEANGFVWGGKWDAFDIMHFEYRPELFTPRRDDLVPGDGLQPARHVRLLP